MNWAFDIVVQMVVSVAVRVFAQFKDNFSWMVSTSPDIPKR